MQGEAIRDDQALRRFVARAPVNTVLALSVRDDEGRDREVNLVTVERPD